MEEQENNRSVLIISGFNQRAIISFCRFANENSIDFYIVAKDKNDTILLSNYRNRIVDIREKLSITLNDFEKWKREINKKEIVILPSAEYLNRFILENRKFLENINYIIPLCEMNLYNKISDKYSFTALCKKHKIIIPKEYSDDLIYPCVAKPKQYFNRDGQIVKPAILYSKETQNAFAEKYNLDEFYFQEFIQGKSIYLLFYFFVDGRVSLFSQENLIQQDNGLSIIAAISSDHHLNDIASKYKNMFLQLSFHGLIMIETKFYKNQYYMIEANPRLWGPSQLILDSGMDLFYRFAEDLGLMRINTLNKSYKKDIAYFWSGGIYSDSKEKLEVTYHGNYNQEKFMQDYYNFFSSEVYLRDDTINIFHAEHKSENAISVLVDLYSKTSKHSNYQKLPTEIGRYLNEDSIKIVSRYENERLLYILKNVTIDNKTVLDIGANTGFFSFELLKAGVKSVYMYEGNKNHADFIKYAAKMINVNDKITINNTYFDFCNNMQDVNFDIVLLLNVLHHVGDDYGDSQITIQTAKNKILESINNFYGKTDILIFQLGFNWQGDRNKPFFSTGTKKEMIEFLQEGISRKWNVLKIGIPISLNDKIEYCDIDDENIKRIDRLGEFLNRPLFIFQSKGCQL
jgi:SAM-dependent methyltransferase